VHSGAIDQSTYDGYWATYARATRSLRKLSGTRHSELAAVLANLEAMARANELIASRLPVAFSTLQRNWEWWTTKPLLGSGQRVAFPGSRLVWEHYAGQGIEIQWLATFGEANSYWFAHETAALEQVLDEAIALASRRAGGIAWDYMFQFDGGAPPWTSGLSQGTGLQALARAWRATGQDRYLTAAQQALGVFRMAPPEGVLDGTTSPEAAATPRSASGGGEGGAGSREGDAGAWYLQYSYAPSEHVLNGFIQALVGLYDYARLTGDPTGQQLFEAGDERARAQVARFDTGAWSKYDQSSESDLGYHDLLTEFLEHLCERTRQGEPLSGRSSATGGATATPGGSGAIAGDEIYCTTASRFRADLKTPPVVQLLTSSVNSRERAGVQMRLSKVSTVTMTIALGGKTVWSNRATVEGGKPRLLWVTPSKPGAYQVALRARDLAGNEEVASGSIVVKARPHKSRGHGRSRSGSASKARAATARVHPGISPRARRLPAL
jgi:D-glucuronyl C5-epimerase-like protein